MPLPRRGGLAWGSLGVLAFSLSVPLTRIAVRGLSPLFIGSARAVVAAALAAAALSLARQPRPARALRWRLGVVAAGVVVGFPLLSSYALTTASASHSAVVIGLLPAATAAVAVLRTRERPGGAFWVFAGLGAVVAVGFASLHGGGPGRPQWADVLLLGAVLAAAVGYAEGGLIARELGAWQTISWALVLSAPLVVALGVLAAVRQPPRASAPEWLAFAYLGAVSMFLGFFAWYRGLAIGPMAQVSQTQLAQPVLSIVWAALLLREHLTASTVLGGLAVVACAGLAVRVRLSRGRRAGVRRRTATAPAPTTASVVD